MGNLNQQGDLSHKGICHLCSNGKREGKRMEKKIKKNSHRVENVVVAAAAAEPGGRRAIEEYSAYFNTESNCGANDPTLLLSNLDRALARSICPSCTHLE